MLQNLRQISILNKVFNVNNNEWPKIILAWAIGLFYRIGFVIGWTVVVGLFVSRFGISSLPYLFIINALFTIIGSVLYSLVLDRMGSTKIMITSLFLGAISLIGAYYFANSNIFLFFGGLILAEAVFLYQFRLLFYGVVEEMFTPIQSERTFPVIEAADTVGGILAGLLVFSFSNSINIPSFILIWAIFVLMIVPLMFSYELVNKKFRIEHAVDDEYSSSIGLYSRIKREFSDSKYLSYVKGLFMIVFFQWVLFNLLEYQYTRAVYANVSQVVLEAGSGFEHAIVHDLGGLFILFSASALLIQLFVGSRLIDNLGVFGTMLLHPIMTLFSVFGLTLSFGFKTAVLAKNNFTITSILHLNSYHSSYYALKEKYREHIREFLDGIIRPIGAIFGTLILFSMQRFFEGGALIFYINVAMTVICFLLFHVTSVEQKRYTLVALDDLQNSKDKSVRLNALDILAQKGHSNSIDVITSLVLSKKESLSIRVRALRSLAELQNLDAIPVILSALKCSNYHLRHAAIDTLHAYKVFRMKRKQKKFIVLEHEILIALQDAYKHEDHDVIKAKLLNLFSKISTVSAFEFLLRALKSARGSHKADVIAALGNYSDEAVLNYIRPYMKAKGLSQKVASIVALGKFSESREEALGKVSYYLNSDDDEKIASALYIIGELKLSKKKRFLYKYLHSENPNLKINASIALAKMGSHDSMPELVSILFGQNRDLALRVRNELSSVDYTVAKNLDKVIRKLVTVEIEKILPDRKMTKIKRLTAQQLTTLNWLFSLAEEYDELEYINSYIKNK